MLGLFDPSARLHTERDLLTFALPYRSFARMAENVPDSFLMTKLGKPRSAAGVRRLPPKLGRANQGPETILPGVRYWRGSQHRESNRHPCSIARSQCSAASGRSPGEIRLASPERATEFFGLSRAPCGTRVSCLQACRNCTGRRQGSPSAPCPQRQRMSVLVDRFLVPSHLLHRRRR